MSSESPSFARERSFARVCGWTLGVALLVACAPSPVTVTGRASYEGETDHAGIVVSFSGRTGQAGTVTDGDGHFSVSLPPGDYAVVFAAPDSLELTRTLAARLSADATLDEVSFRPAGRIEGTVFDATTEQPLEGAWVLSVRGSAATRTQADGSFHLRGVPAGAATVVVSHAGRAPAQRQTWCARSEVAQVGSLALGPWTDHSTPASLAGRVLFPDGTAAPSAQVVVRGVGEERSTVADSEGRFRFERLGTEVVSVSARTPGYEATLPTVLSMEGTSGFIIGDGLFPLAPNPITLTRGRRLTEMTRVELTPDQRTLIGNTNQWPGNNLRAISFDGGSVDLLAPQELGFGTPYVTAIGQDSTTVAVYVPPPGQSGGQLFLASTASRGRQLISEQGCSLGNDRSVLVVRQGERCRSGGPTLVVPLRFGATPVDLGALSDYWHLDFAGRRVFNSPPLAYNVRALEVVPFSGGPRRQLLGRYDNYGTFSADARLFLYSSAGSTHLLDLDTGVSREVFAGASAAGVFAGRTLWLTVWSQTAQQTSLYAVDLNGSGGPVPMATGISRFITSPNGKEAAVLRAQGHSGLSTLSLVRLGAATEQPLTADVAWVEWSASGELYYLGQVELSRSQGSLWRAGTSRAPQELAAGVSSSGAHPPRWSPDGQRLAYVKRTHDVLRAACLKTQDGSSADLGALADLRLSTASWTFSLDGHWLVFTGAKQAPETAMLTKTTGGALVPLTSSGGVTWLKDGSLLVTRVPQSAAEQALGGTYHATVP